MKRRDHSVQAISSDDARKLSEEFATQWRQTGDATALANWRALQDSENGYPPKGDAAPSATNAHDLGKALPKSLPSSTSVTTDAGKIEAAMADVAQPDQIQSVCAHIEQAMRHERAAWRHLAAASVELYLEGKEWLAASEAFGRGFRNFSDSHDSGLPLAGRTIRERIAIYQRIEASKYKERLLTLPAPEMLVEIGLRKPAEAKKPKIPPEIAAAAKVAAEERTQELMVKIGLTQPDNSVGKDYSTERPRWDAVVAHLKAVPILSESQKSEITGADSGQRGHSCELLPLEFFC